MAFHSTQNRYQVIFRQAAIFCKSSSFLAFCDYSLLSPSFLHFSQGLFSLSQPIISSGLQAFVLTVPSALIVFPALALPPTTHTPSLRMKFFQSPKLSITCIFFICKFLCFFSQYLSQVVITCSCVLQYLPYRS